MASVAATSWAEIFSNFFSNYTANTTSTNATHHGFLTDDEKKILLGQIVGQAIGQSIGIAFGGPVGGVVLGAFGNFLGGWLSGETLGGAAEAAAYSMLGGVAGSFMGHGFAAGKLAGSYIGDLLGSIVGSVLQTWIDRKREADAKAAGIIPPPGFGSLLFSDFAKIIDEKIAEIYKDASEFSFKDFVNKTTSPLVRFLRDPLVLDLDGNGIAVSALGVAGQPGSSNVHFDFSGNGHLDRTAWVGSGDGILVRDANHNGKVDGASELFGSDNQDGFNVLEAFDTNHDNKIGSGDDVWADLRVWRDANGNGVVDDGELQTLTDAGVASINLARTQSGVSINDSKIGYTGSFTREDGTIGDASTVYLAVDHQNTAPVLDPNFVPNADAQLLPQLPGSGQIYASINKLTTDTDFRAAWTALANNVANLTPGELHAQFEHLVLQWAGVDETTPYTRGSYVDAKHLAFVEAFFGTKYTEIHWGVSDSPIAGSPTTQDAGNSIEASYRNIVDVLETIFLAQTSMSAIARGADLTTVFDSPYLFYGLLDFSDPTQSSNPPATPGNLGAVLEAITTMAPNGSNDALGYYEKALSGLRGFISTTYKTTAELNAVIDPVLSVITDEPLRHIAHALLDGTGIVAMDDATGYASSPGTDAVFIAGKGDALFVGSTGTDTYVYAKADGNIYIKDDATSVGDTLYLQDINASDVTLVRTGDQLYIRVKSGTDASGNPIIRTVTAENFFSQWGVANNSIDKIRFADGTIWDRSDIQSHSAFSGYPNYSLINDTVGADVIRPGSGNFTLQISGGGDTILYSKGDGYYSIRDNSADNKHAPNDTLKLTDLSPSDVELARVGTALIIKVLATGERIVDESFFTLIEGTNHLANYGIDVIQFANGVRWDKDQIQANAPIRGTQWADTLVSSALDDLISGGHGGDYIHLEGGHDKIIWSKGDGSDTIENDLWGQGKEHATLVLTDVAKDHAKFSFVGNDLIIQVLDTDEVLRVVNFFDGIDDIHSDTATDRGLEAIQFSNGTLTRSGILEKTAFDFQGRKIVWSEQVLMEDGGLLYSKVVDETGKMTLTGGFLPGGYPQVWGRFSQGVAGGNNILYHGDGTPTLSVSGGGNNQLIGYGVQTLDATWSTGVNILRGDPDAIGSTLLGGSSTDYIYANKQSYTDAGAGDDFIESFEGATVRGGLGDDVVDYRSGTTTFLYNAGDGNDTYSPYVFNNTAPLLRLSNITPDDVVLSIAPDNASIYIDIKTTGERITLANAKSLEIGVAIEFVGTGVTWSPDEVRNQAWYRGDNTANFIDAVGAGTVEGGFKDDAVQFHNGTHTFVYKSGDGNDSYIPVVSENRTQTLKLVDLLPSDVAIGRSNNNLYVWDLKTEQHITFEDWNFGGTYNLNIQFLDGTVWSEADIESRAWYRGTNTMDELEVWGDTWVNGRKGDDTVYFHNGQPNFVYAHGDGNDVYSPRTSSNPLETLNLTDINFDEVYLSREGQDLIIRDLTTDQTVTFLSWNAGQNYNVQIKFADGRVLANSEIDFWTSTGDYSYSGSWRADTIVGSSRTQLLYGAEGDDFIDGRGGSDTINGGYGNDTIGISVANQNDLYQIDGAEGVNEITFKDFASAVSLDLASNTIEAQTNGSSDLSSGPLHTIATLANIQNLTGSAFGDYLAGDGNDNYISGGAGNDTILGRSGNDVLKGGVGDDLLVGGSGSTTFVFERGDGHDVIQFGSLAISQAVRNTIQFGQGIAATDLHFSRTGNDLVITIDGSSDQLVINDQFASGENLQRIDTLNFVDGTAVSAFEIQKIIHLTEGNTTLEHVLRDGSVVIDDIQNSGWTDLSLAFVNAKDVVLSSSGSNLLISIPSFGQSITLIGALDARGVSLTELQFADGTVSLPLIKNQLGNGDQTILISADSSDTVNGDGTNNILIGGKGADILSGWAGDDTYIYQSGDGNDRIQEHWHFWDPAQDNALKLVGLNAADISVARSNGSNDLVVTVLATGETITVESQFAETDGLARIVFADGTTWDRHQIEVQSGVFQNHAPTVIQEIASQSVPLGNQWSFTIPTTTFADSDNEAMTISASLSNGSGLPSWLTFDAATQTFTGVVPADFTGNLEVIVTATDPEGLSVSDTFSIAPIVANDVVPSYLEGITIIAGTSGADTLYGNWQGEALIGGLGDDTLYGGEGNDVYVYKAGDGNDIISESSWNGDNDRLVLQGLNRADIDLLRVSGNQDDIVVKIRSTGETITLQGQTNGWQKGVESIVFADGTTLDWNQIRDQAILAGTAGDDTLYGGWGWETIAGGLGNDALYGGEGNDTYVYQAGDGNDIISESSWNGDNDRLVLQGLNRAEIDLLRVSGNQDDIVVKIRSTGETITLQGQTNGWQKGVESIVFADGTTLDWNQIRDQAVLAGTAGNDTLYGGWGWETIAGGLGNDALYGGEGNDTYVYQAGDGNDIITESSWNGDNDRLVLQGLNRADIDLVRVSGNQDDIVVRIRSTGETITLQNQTNGWQKGVESIVFADGTTLDWNQIRDQAVLAGTAGDDTLYGSWASETISGGLGNDTLYGGEGNDTYVYQAGDGNDVITDGWWSGNDRLMLVGLNQEDVNLYQLSNNSDDIFVGINGTGATITLTNQTHGWGEQGVESIVFADGTTLNWSQIQSQSASHVLTA